MWRKIFRPDVLLFIAMIQVLFPYVLWAFGIQVAKYPHNLTYLPIVYWTGGVFFFWLGGMFIRPRKQLLSFRIAPNRRRIIACCLFLVVCVALQLLLIIQLYGTLPILSFLRNDHEFNVVTSSRMQEESALGQIGLMYMTLLVGNGALLLLCILNLEPGGKRVYVILILFFVILLLGGIYNGKRQNLLAMLVFLFAGLALYSNNLFFALKGVLPILRHRVVNIIAVFIVFYGVVGFFGVMSSLRNQNRYQVSGLDEIIAYYEYPVLNFEAQCAVSGFLPYEFNLLYPVKQLLPYKLIDRLSWPDPPPRLERSAPAGMFEYIQWAWGFPGTVIFSLLLGILSMWLYQRVLSSPVFLLIYCQFVVAFVFAHSFNYFLILVYVTAPCLAFLLIGRLLLPSRSKYLNGPPAEPLRLPINTAVFSRSV